MILNIDIRYLVIDIDNIPFPIGFQTNVIMVSIGAQAGSPQTTSLTSINIPSFNSSEIRLL